MIIIIIIKHHQTSSNIIKHHQTSSPLKITHHTHDHHLISTIIIMRNHHPNYQYLPLPTEIITEQYHQKGCHHHHYHHHNDTTPSPQTTTPSPHITTLFTTNHHHHITIRHLCLSSFSSQPTINLWVVLFLQHLNGFCLGPIAQGTSPLTSNSLATCPHCPPMCFQVTQCLCQLSWITF